MFAKRARPAGGASARRERADSGSDGSSGEPFVVQTRPQRKVRVRQLSESPERDRVSGNGQVRKKATIAACADTDGAAFQVKKTRASRNMSASTSSKREERDQRVSQPGHPRASEPHMSSIDTIRSKYMPEVGRAKRGLGSHAEGRRSVTEHGVPDAPSEDEEGVGAPAVPELGFVEDGALPGDDVDYDAEDAKSGAAARLARAQRAAARELDGSSAVPAAKAEYIPLARGVPGRSGNAEEGDKQSTKFSNSALALAVNSQLGAEEEASASDKWALNQMRVGAHRRNGALPALGLTNGEDPSKTLNGAPSMLGRGSGNTSVTSSAVSKYDVKAPSLMMAELWDTIEKLEGGAEDNAKRSDEVKSQQLLATEQVESFGKQEALVHKVLRAARDLEEFSWGLGGLLDTKVGKLRQALKTLARMEEDFVAKRYRRRNRDLMNDLVHVAGVAISKPQAGDGEVEEARDISVIKQAVEARRERRKMRRQQRLYQDMSASTAALQREGWDTSSASEEDGLSELQTDRSAFCNAAHKQIFGDVAEEFSVVSEVLRPLSAAKKRLDKDYAAAHVPPSLLEALTPHIEHSLLWWDPFRICAPPEPEQERPPIWGPFPAHIGAQLDGFSWFEALSSFTEQTGEEDPDGDLLPTLVQKCVFPEVERRLRKCWDVTSSRQSAQVSLLLDECLLFEVDSSANSFAGLLEVVLQRLELGLAECAPEVFVAAPTIPRWYDSGARRRLLWRSCKIAHCALLLEGRLPDDQLSSLVLGDVFATRMLPHIRTPRLDSEELAMIERFVFSLPERWLMQGLPQSLAALRDALGPRAPQCPEANATADIAARVLHRLRCFDEAQVILDGLQASEAAP